MTSPFEAPAQTPGQPLVLAKGKLMAVISGKGGVGKTFFSANLAATLARKGHKVLVIDADLGLANLDVVLNLQPKLTLHDVLNGKAKVQDAIVKAPGGFWVMLAGSGMVEYARLTPDMQQTMLAVMADLVPQFDVVLLDTGAGISDVVLFAVSMASEVLLVATPEPTSLTDAYATIKVLSAQQGRSLIRMVVNQTSRPAEGKTIVTQLQHVIARFLTVGKTDAPALKLVHMGDIPADPAVKSAVMRRQLMVSLTPGCPAGVALGQIATRLEDLVLHPQG